MHFNWDASYFIFYFVLKRKAEQNKGDKRYFQFQHCLMEQYHIVTYSLISFHHLYYFKCCMNQKSRQQQLYFKNLYSRNNSQNKIMVNKQQNLSFVNHLNACKTSKYCYLVSENILQSLLFLQKQSQFQKPHFLLKNFVIYSPQFYQKFGILRERLGIPIVGFSNFLFRRSKNDILVKKQNQQQQFQLQYPILLQQINIYQKIDYFKNQIFKYFMQKIMKECGVYYTLVLQWQFLILNQVILKQDMFFIMIKKIWNVETYYFNNQEMMHVHQQGIPSFALFNIFDENDRNIFLYQLQIIRTFLKQGIGLIVKAILLNCVYQQQKILIQSLKSMGKNIKIDQFDRINQICFISVKQLNIKKG
ncbi:unnamed protein product [Paramecium sonneborni]|uniref:Uncharacterized protein n=1 Tax=Paramecium sonneborni TaxID=65129 RepID=A0A8S1KLG8_9CILI|nr:unnamed protein product [Paramecium sonneborni]